MRRVMVGGVLLALALSGCEMRAEIEVNEDGSGTIGFVFAMEALLFGTMPSDMDPLAMARADLRDDPIPWKIENYVGNGMKGFRATAPFRSIEHLSEMLAEQARADGQTPLDAEGFTIERATGGGWRFEMNGDAPGQDLMSGFGGNEDTTAFGGEFGEDGGFTPEMPDLGIAADGLRFEFHVTLPGDPDAHNSPEVKQKDGKSTFLWRYNLADTHPISLKASTTPPGFSLPIIPLGAVLLVLGGGVLFARRRRSPASFGQMPPVVLEGLPPLASRTGEAWTEGSAPEATAAQTREASQVEASVSAETSSADQTSLLAELGDD